MFKKIIGWITYIPASYIAYIVVSTILLFILPYVFRIIFWLIGFDYTPEPYFFEFERKFNETKLNIEQTIEEYISVTLVILCSFVIAGIATGFVASWLCPYKNNKTISIPVVIVLILFSIAYLLNLDVNYSIYVHIIILISIILSIVAFCITVYGRIK